MPSYRAVMSSAFSDELEKIAGKLTNLARSGRRPISAAKLLAKSGTTKMSEMLKVSAISAKSLALMGVGAYGLNEAQKVKRRYDTGKLVEYQQRAG